MKGSPCSFSPKTPGHRPDSAGDVAAQLAAIINADDTDAIQSSDEKVRKLTAEFGETAPATLEARLHRVRLIAASGDIAGAVRECDRIAAQYAQMYGTYDHRTCDVRNMKQRLTFPG
ncbi:hypothetical protein [Nonomuraea salmonea]|uniref:hypothetical protein n=1 Tax=Nonomuraea salmonea TaxID=46181 RepID=UPI002FE8B651